jgi:hypothetical protein
MRVCFILGLLVVAGCAGVGTPETQTVAIGLDLAPLPGADLLGPADPGHDLATQTQEPHDMAVKPGDDLSVVTPPVVDMAQAPAPVFDLSSASGCTGHLVINEVKVAGSSNVDDEFIEIFNPCATSVSLANWTVAHLSATGTAPNVIATLTGSIGGNAYYLVAESSCACSTSADLTYTTGTLAATGGGVALRNAAGTVVDSVGYGTGTANSYVEGAPAAAPSGGSSIGRHPNGHDTDHNDADFTVATTPTPRAANP